MAKTETARPIGMMNFIFKKGARSVAEVAVSFAFAIARLAQANSVARIASPTIKTAIPGPGVTIKRTPRAVTIPPKKAITNRQANLPAGVDLIHVMSFMDAGSLLSSLGILGEV
jgi:hypothetical protein